MRLCDILFTVPLPEELAVCLTQITYIRHDCSCHHNISTRNIVWQWKKSWWMWVILVIWNHFQELTLYN